MLIPVWLLEKQGSLKSCQLYYKFEKSQSTLLRNSPPHWMTLGSQLLPNGVGVGDPRGTCCWIKRRQSLIQISRVFLLLDVHQVTGANLPTRLLWGVPWWISSSGSPLSLAQCPPPLGTAPRIDAVMLLGISGPRQWEYKKAGSGLTLAWSTVDLTGSDAQRQTYWSCLAQ